MNILWLKTELLHPVDKGGKIRTYNTLKELRRDHRITYLTLDDGSSREAERQSAEEYCHELIGVPHRVTQKFSMSFYGELFSNLASNLPYAISKYESGAMRQKIAELVQSRRHDMVVCDFLAPAINLPMNLGCPSVLFQHNVEAMIWKRHYEVQTNALKKIYLYGQWKRMEAFERRMCQRFGSVIGVSKADRDQMKKDYGVQRVFDVPTGVDTTFFRPTGTEIPSQYNLIFTGSMDWLPNEDAIRYFTESILPIIKQQLPQVTLTVVGRNPYPSLVELARTNPSITVTGRVDDVRPYMERAAVYIVPLRIGGGTRLKIFEAMAMEKAIVSTSVGAEGLPVKDGQELLLADTPESFAGAVVKLLKDKSVAHELGQQAASAVRANYGWRAVAEQFAAICEGTNTADRQAARREHGEFVYLSD
jgi:polysaccharide biosynthesis protein PslH